MMENNALRIWIYIQKLKERKVAEKIIHNKSDFGVNHRVP